MGGIAAIQRPTWTSRVARAVGSPLLLSTGIWTNSTVSRPVLAPRMVNDCWTVDAWTRWGVTRTTDSSIWEILGRQVWPASVVRNWTMAVSARLREMD